MKRITKLFLIYILSIISVLGTYSVAEAHSATFGGSADRVRKYDGLNYVFLNGNRYYDSGFHCTPDKIRSDYDIVFSDKQKSDISKVFEGLAVGSVETVDIVATPLICGYILKTYAKNGVGAGTFASSIAALFGGALEALYAKYIGETDFGLELTNTMCLPIIVPLIGTCLSNFVLMSTSMSSTIKTVIFATSTIIYATAKEVYGNIQLSQARDTFNNIKVCGDDWYTYGNADLQEKLNNGSTSGYLNNNSSVKEEYIRRYYPVKGIFVGSYKYYLDRCINLRDSDSCNKIDFVLNDSVQFSDKNKIYREYKYGGIEYQYSMCNDPRPEAKSYDVNIGKTSIPQLYYASGLDGINFACERFLEKTEWYDDYKCCVNASKRLLCLEYNENNIERNHTFCDKDSDCFLNVKGIGNFGEKEKTIRENLKISDNICNEIFSKSEYKSEYEKICGGSNAVTANCIKMKKDMDECESKVRANMNSSQEADASKSFFSQLSKDSVRFKIRESTQNPNKYCFTTQSFCPYDFNVLGGTEKTGTEFNDTNECNINEKTEVYECSGVPNEICTDSNTNTSLDCHGQPSNFCQLDRHCMMLKPYPDIDIEPPAYPYIDKACLNNVGSSHNDDYFSTYDSYTRKVNLKTHLTTPIVECVVETSKNLLFNRAGFTSCKNTSETPTENEVCYSGYRFKKGEDVSQYGYNNFIEKVRGRLSNLVKLLLIFAVMMYGFNLVVIGKKFKQEEFVAFFAKIVLVIMLSLSTNWTKVIFDGVYTVSGAIINFTYNILQIDDWKPSYDNKKFDGCYFAYNKNFDNNYSNYPSGRKYLAFFDYIDCKFQKYMGFDAGSIDIINVIILFVLTGILTLILVLPLLMIFLMLISIIVKITYIFIVAMLTLTILLFLTPIMMPLSLFSKTKKIFKSWYKRIIAFIFYPMFLIVSVTILFFIYDKFFINEAIYFGTGNAPYRTIYCGRICKIENRYEIINNNVSDSDAEEACEVKLGGELVDLMEYPICIYKANEKVSDKSIDFLSFFTGLRFPILKISTSLYKFLFTNYAILFIILLFIEATLDSIIEIGSVIFDASVDGGAANKFRFTNTFGKLFGWAMNNTSRTINTGVGLSKAGLSSIDHEHKQDEQDNSVNRENMNFGNGLMNDNNE